MKEEFQGNWLEMSFYLFYFYFFIFFATQHPLALLLTLATSSHLRFYTFFNLSPWKSADSIPGVKDGTWLKPYYLREQLLD